MYLIFIVCRFGRSRVLGTYHNKQEKNSAMMKNTYINYSLTISDLGLLAWLVVLWMPVGAIALYGWYIP